MIGSARRSAALLGSVLIATTLTAAPAAPAAAASKTRYVRYAGASCLGKKGTYHVCAPWRLVLRGGRVVRLTEARVFMTPDKKGLSPFGLSPHGSQAAYFRLKDGALVIRDVTTGKVRVVPGITWSPDAPQISLSPGGRYILLRHRADPRQVVDSITGEVHTFGFLETPVSFSPDNKYLLTSSPNAGGAVYATSNWSVVRRGKWSGSLKMGGTRIAFIDRSRPKRTYIRFFDLITSASVGTGLRVPAGELALWVLWDRAGHLDVLTRLNAHPPGGGITYRWRRANAGMRVLDTFVHRSSHDDEIDHIAGVPDL